MNLADICPMILTYNEEANIRDTLSRLRWASRIVLVDSFSNDQTLQIAGCFPQVEVVQRPFDHFADQCNFGLTHIGDPWVLSLDADYKCSRMFSEELSELPESFDGYEASFVYGIYGRPLRATLYPPRIVLYRRHLAEYRRDGHAHRVSVDGDVGKLSTPILHDDWKPLSSWCASQVKYARLEADKLLSSDMAPLGWKDRLRKKLVLAPVMMLFYCLFGKRLVLDGWPGVFYSLQRFFAELVLSLTLLERRLKSRPAGDCIEQEPRSAT